MITGINIKDFKKKISESNENAAKNPNLYPIQEQATLMEIWEYTLCECPGECTCKRFGCTQHYRLKKGMTNDDVLRAFLRMFVNKNHHERLKKCINKNDHTIELSPRVKMAKEAFECYIIKKKIDLLATHTNMTLLCDWDVVNRELLEMFKKIWGFSVSISVYYSKINCILFPDICIPYDSASREKIKSCLNIKSSIAYFDMLIRLRSWIINLLESWDQPLSELRKVDRPQEKVPFEKNKISLRREDFDYGDIYFPEERPLSRIIDKFFYKPSKERNTARDIICENSVVE